MPETGLTQRRNEKPANKWNPSKGLSKADPGSLAVGGPDNIFIAVNTEGRGPELCGTASGVGERPCLCHTSFFSALLLNYSGGQSA